MDDRPGFSGSYDPDDVTFLLRPVAIEPTPAEERERLMQSGERHYSELLPPESPPPPAYLRHYEDALRRNGARMALELAGLAEALGLEARQRPGGEPPVLVSLARAGTPVGVLLRRFLRRRGIDAPHYSVSIIRDRGLDAVAMEYILRRHGTEGVVFVDGWTGKGSIRRTLSAAVRSLRESGLLVPDRLLVLADLAGVADLAATDDDYVIPSAVLNAVVSGLVSRTVLNDAVVSPGQVHACRYYEEWREHDVSRSFVDTVDALDPGTVAATRWPPERRDARAATCRAFLQESMQRWRVDRPHRIKPGAGEATRAVLRRLPQHVAVRDPDDPELAHLRFLCARAAVPVEVWPSMPYRAVTVIRPVE